MAGPGHGVSRVVTTTRRARRGPADAGRLLVLSLRMVAGRRFWVAPLLPLIWPAFQILRLLLGWRPQGYTAEEAQNLLIAFPLVVLAIGLGVRIIAAEIDRRTLEIAYTVPGGAHKVWLAKLAATSLLLLATELLLAAVAYAFCTAFPIVATLYGAWQPAMFFLVLAMALSALFRSEAAGALVTAAVLALCWPLQQAGTRLSPFWNPAALTDADPSNLVAWTVQNRLGFLLLALALVVLAFGRAENREKLLGG
ncbi:MAG TPA: hypothetical protein VD788_13990 [Candidatus Polarisedimenticolaceae bacterium]|nr:hypothetical protein [Candidatus Polarisedimenticolaceae bacterium]